MDKRCYHCKVTKSITEFGKDKSRNDGIRPLCKACVSVKNKNRRIENPEKARAADKSWYDRNRERKVAETTAWNKANRDRYRINKNTSNKKRRLIQNQMPRWTDDELIRRFYEQAAELTKVTGIKYSVDHIVPINNPKVCGLHSHTNMRVTPLIDNIKKGNRVWPDMW